MTGWPNPLPRIWRWMTLGRRVAVLETQVEQFMSDLDDLKTASAQLADDATAAITEMQSASAEMADLSARLKAASDANDLVSIRQISAQLHDASQRVRAASTSLHQSTASAQDVSAQADSLAAAQSTDTITGAAGNDTTTAAPEPVAA